MPPPGARLRRTSANCGECHEPANRSEPHANELACSHGAVNFNLVYLQNKGGILLLPVAYWRKDRWMRVEDFQRGLRVWTTFVGIAATSYVFSAEPSHVRITAIEEATGRPMPVRVHLKDSSGKAHQPKLFPFWRDHFVCPGDAMLDLAAGAYTMEIERGPEFSAHRSEFSVVEGTATNITVTLDRIVDLAAEGWWSGELHVHRPIADAELLMRAEDLHVAPFITWWNRQNLWSNGPPANPLRQFDGNRFTHVLGGEDEREGGALLYFNLKQPLAITSATRHFPSSVVYAEEARKQRAWIDIEKPFWWDFPLWLASGLCDSVGIANNHMHRAGMYNGEAWGRARNTNSFPTARGNGFWSQEIYYHALNCGLRIPPSAGSASGVLPNPVGYNRVYVQIGSTLTYDKWWDGLRAGRSFVSNGPLLRCRANGKWPGEIFAGANNAPVEIDIEATLNSRDAVPALEIIRDGKVVRAIPANADGRRILLGKLSFTESGWFLVRAISSETNTFRFASTAPFYVEVGANKQRISKASAQFFLDWVKEGMGRIQLPEGERREAVLQTHRTAEKFWTEKVARANAP